MTDTRDLNFSEGGLPQSKLRPVSEGIADCIKASGLSRKDFAEVLGVTYRKLASYIEGRAEPNIDFFRRLAQHYPGEYFMNIIMGSIGGFTSTPPGEAIITERHIPVLHTIHAGELVQGVSDEEIIGWRATRLKDENMFALQVRGESMFPEIEEGDFVLYAPRRPFVNGKVYAVVVDEGEATIKRVFRRKGGYDLVATNPEFDTLFVEEARVLKLVRAVEIQRDLN